MFRWRLVRAMPNLPATIRAGVTVAVATAQVDPDRRQLVSSVFRALGSFHWVNNEDWLDAVTGISGSGPAYFFRFDEFPRVYPGNFLKNIMEVVVGTYFKRKM